MSKNDMRQIVLGAAGSLLLILIIAIWGWISAGGLVRGLGGVSQTQLANAIQTQLELADTIQTQLADAIAEMEASPAEQSEIAGLLANVVILTDQECKIFGPNWKRYEKMDGRFPLGAGQTKDTNGESPTFTVGQAEGAYQHELTEPEMPLHTHSFHGSRGDRVVDDWDNEWGHRNQKRETGPAGEGKPHNNMPPYFVVNFCHLEKETQTD